VIYLDWNATTPPADEVVRAMTDVLGSVWGNASSVHGVGRLARARVEDGRAAVARLLGFDPRDVILTSGGTESNNVALRSVVGAGGTLVTSRLEHPSVTRVAELVASRGARVVWLEPSPSGLIEVADVEAALASTAAGPVLVSLMAVNHETGVIQPVPEVADVAHRHGALLHVDAVQAVGKLPPSAWAGADLISMAAHKLRGPKGVGALASRPGLKLAPVLRGGAQERGLRPGTVDPVSIAGLEAAAARAVWGPQRMAEIAPLRDRLEAALVELGGVVNGAARRVPHVTNVSFPGWVGAELVVALDLEGLAVSSGSACSAGTAEPSPVIAAMVGRERASSAVRISMGDTTTSSEVDAAIRIFRSVLGRSVGR
jgi:cysteine desulfurase